MQDLSNRFVMACIELNPIKNQQSGMNLFFILLSVSKGMPVI